MPIQRTGTRLPPGRGRLQANRPPFSPIPMTIAETTPYRESSPRAAAPAARPRAHGKFLWAGAEKLLVRGVTYGTFRPTAAGEDCGDPVQVGRDFAAMAASGMNAVRTYTAPPRWLLDIAAEHGLRVLAGLPWEEHITFLDDRGRLRAIEKRLRAHARALAGHPALLAYAVGNEIPAGIVRWHGRQQIEGAIARLALAVKEEDPAGLVTYVNYPTTEYLDLDCLDLVCFNVYLEVAAHLEAYLARLQNLAGNRPLLMTELGLDSRRHGLEVQASTLAWQLETTFAAGAAGAFVFAWTDEWFRGGHDIEDWDFGLTTRERAAKPALAAVRDAFAGAPFPPAVPRPPISVVVCSYNGERTIRHCLTALAALDYPDFEVILVDDGSRDSTAAIGREYGCRVISTNNRGLSSARNTGLAAARGEIVAYIDDDAYPDPHWLEFLAHSFRTAPHAGVGGPNLPPPGDGLVAACVAAAPGGPNHVLLSDREAEHIPGCNMAFRRSALQEIGGFDTRFRTAGDDVDVCWRLQERGYSLGFHAAAMVWHRRRNSIGAYWKQQLGYGKAEALLERKWPEKYNVLGHVSWAGRIYGSGLTRALGLGRGRIYQGTWGSAPFQSVYEPAAGFLRSLPLMPEWVILVATLAMLSLLGVHWPPLRAAFPLFIFAAGWSVAQAAGSAWGESPPRPFATRGEWLRFRLITTYLHLLQPVARLRGRLDLGLTVWRQRGVPGRAFPFPQRFAIWSESWRPAEDWLGALAAFLREHQAAVEHGGAFDHWDLTVRDGTLGAVRILMAIEEHGAGKQLIRFRLWPTVNRGALLIFLVLTVLALAAVFDGAIATGAILAIVPLAMLVSAVDHKAKATAAVRAALRRLAAEAGRPSAPEPGGRNGDSR